MSPRISHTKAATLLAATDSVVAGLLAQAGPPRLGKPQGDHFAALVRAVTFQQLAGKAATSIHNRLVAALDGRVTAEQVLATPIEDLRGAGLSAAKAASILDLASRTAEGQLVFDGRRLGRLSDQQVVEMLSAVRGIGRWTAEMFLMFELRRLDIWPTGDLGVRKGFGLAWGLPMPTAKELEPMGDSFRPYRSVVAWYCWRACEIYAGAGPSALTK